MQNPTCKSRGMGGFSGGGDGLISSLSDGSALTAEASGSLCWSRWWVDG